jgi:transposase-like protein
MKYKIYSNEIKLAVVNEYLVIKKLKPHEIQTKYELSTITLIYNWVKEYQEKKELAFTKKIINPTSHRIDKKDIENKLLKEKNKKLNQKLLKKEIENELLKERLTCEKKQTNINVKNNLNCKCLKNKCFLIVEKYRKDNKVTDIIALLPISITAYYKWVDKEKPNYRSKADLVAIENEINKIVINGENNEKYIQSTSLAKVVIILKQNNPNLKCSKTSVDTVLIKNQIKLLKPLKPRRKSTNKDNSSDNKNDLLSRDFSTQRPFEKVGMDGTWFKNLTIGDKKIKLLVELATDMHNDKIVGWKVGSSENTTVVLDVVQQVALESNKFNKFAFTTIQTDLGSANISRSVEKHFKNSTRLIHSKSLSGFKGNQVSECLNRWIKRDFKIMFGNTFDSIEQFTETLGKFINWWNNDRIILRLKMSPNQLLQIRKQNIQLN